MEEKLKHEFQQDEAGGETFERSWSHQRCKKCRRAFTHYYNVEGYEEALNKSTIPEECNL